MNDQNTRERISQYSVEELLDTLSLSVMTDNIQSQIEDVNVSNRDFMDTVRGKFDVIKEGDFESETINMVTQEINKFYNTITNQIISKFGLVYDSSEDLEEVAEVLYNFFTLQRKSNTKQFLETYIDEHIDDIISALELEKSNDVLTTSMSKKSGDSKYVRIAANINAVIDYILSMNISSADFLDVLSAEGDYYVGKMMDYADSSEIDGNYPTLYMREILSEYDSDYASEIRNSLRYDFGMRGRNNG